MVGAIGLARGGIFSTRPRATGETGMKTSETRTSFLVPDPRDALPMRIRELAQPASLPRPFAVIRSAGSGRGRAAPLLTRRARRRAG